MKGPRTAFRREWPTRVVEAAAASPDRPQGRSAYDEGFNAGFDRGFDAGYDHAHSMVIRPRWDLYRQAPLQVPACGGLRAVPVVPARNEERTLRVV